MNQMAKVFELFYNDAAAYPTGTGAVGGATSYVVSGGKVLGSIVLAANNQSGSGTLNVTPTYITGVPSAPTPADNSSGSTACTATNNSYMYEADAGGTTYTITFCVGSVNVVGNLPAGIRYLTPGGFK